MRKWASALMTLTGRSFLALVYCCPFPSLVVMHTGSPFLWPTTLQALAGAVVNARIHANADSTQNLQFITHLPVQFRCLHHRAVKRTGCSRRNRRRPVIGGTGTTGRDGQKTRHWALWTDQCPGLDEPNALWCPRISKSTRDKNSKPNRDHRG